MRCLFAGLLLVLCVDCSRTPVRVEPGEGMWLLAVDVGQQYQVVEGFGATSPATSRGKALFESLFYDDLRASILRVDLTPTFQAPYADYAYNSPWFHEAPALPGPDGNNVRIYRDADDYMRPWAGRRAAIAVMGPDLERNLAHFDFDAPATRARGEFARQGVEKRAKLGGFKLIGSLWSPAPWLKLSSGTKYGETSGILPKKGTPFPFIWGGNFAGGVLDVSDTPRALFDDSEMGGAGPTSALTQFARGLASYLFGFQRAFDVRFHAISIQNELNFETFYNSCSYQRTEHYLAALKAVRRELDRHPELAPILIMGPEDLLGNDGYSLWQYGKDETAVHKNLQHLAALEQDAEAKRSLALYAIHGYAADGVTGAGQDPWAWRAWADGWQTSPAPGLPAHVQGFRASGKTSWMTETSGEDMQWGPSDSLSLERSALGLGMKIHQALTTGMQSAWLYWQLVADGPLEGLADEVHRERSPKYVAAKHYFRFIRPGAQRIAVTLPTASPLAASGYLNPDGSRVVVLVNATPTAQTLGIAGWSGDEVRRTRGYMSTVDAPFRVLDASVLDSTAFHMPPYSIATWVAEPP